jgi:hypothetical protein
LRESAELAAGLARLAKRPGFREAGTFCRGGEGIIAPVIRDCVQVRRRSDLI